MNWRALCALLAATLALNGSFFMLVPLFPIYATATLGLSAAAVGLVLAIRQFLQNAPMVLGGAIADRFSARRAMVCGLLVRALAFGALGFATDLPTLTLVLGLAALSGSLFDVSCLAAIARLVPQGDRVRAFGLVSMAFVLGSSLGPLLGTAAYQLGFGFVCLVGAAWLVVAALAIVALVPDWEPVGNSVPSVRVNLSSAFADRAFVRLSIISSGFWYLGSVLYVALPLHVQALTGRTEVVGFLFSLYALLVLLFQYPVIRLSARRLSPSDRLAIGLAALGTGYLLVGATLGAGVVVVAVGVLALGRMLIEPTYNELVTQLSPPGKVGTYVGLGYLGLGIGGALGNLSGGLLFDLAKALDSLWVPWLLYGLLGLGLAVAFRAMRVGAAGRPAAPVLVRHSE